MDKTFKTRSITLINHAAYGVSMSVAAGCTADSATEHAVYKDKKTNTYKRYVICAKKLYDNDMKVVKGFPADLTYKDIVAVQDNIYAHALGCLSEIKL